MNEFSFDPFPTIATENLYLRQLTFEDEKEIFTLRSDANVNKYLDREPAETIEDARDFINKINDGITKNEVVYWAICYKNNLQLIGTICLWKISKKLSKAEIGFELLPDFQGKGVMQEALTKVIEYGFKTMKLHSIEGEVAADNLKSIKLLEKNSFTKVEILNGNDSDETVIYELKNTIEPR